jgi:small subunit ribosomal protein S7
VRKNRAEKRKVNPDPVYNNVIINRIINKIMLNGNKSLSEKIFYDALNKIKEETGEESAEMVKKALDNVMPVLEVKSRRVGGSNYQVPVEVSDHRRLSLAIRWLIDAAHKRGERTMIEKIAGEFIDAANNTGGAVKKKEDVHRMAEANRAFAHYRW